MHNSLPVLGDELAIARFVQSAGLLAVQFLSAMEVFR